MTTRMKCSTPAGITESITFQPERRDHADEVLNACWHHGIDHNPGGAPSDNLNTCSTPAGITESITPRGDRTAGPDHSVLNACWHHGIDHAKGYYVKSDGSLSCSTPAGITESITLQPAHSGQGGQVLNACWHHGIDHHQAVVEAERGDRVLNACWHHGIDHNRHICIYLGQTCVSCAQRLLASRNRSLLADIARRRHPIQV